MNFIFIYGPPAAGKLTVAKALCEITGYKLFHNHLTYDTTYSLFGDDVYSKAFKECCEKLRLTAIKEAIKYDINIIFTMVYDHQNDKNFVEKLSSIVNNAGGTVHFICLKPSLNTIQKRVTENNRKVFQKVASLDELEVFTKHYDIYSSIPNVTSLIIDNSDLKPKDVAKQIVDNIR
mgnify:CR=1 FL=1